MMENRCIIHSSAPAASRSLPHLDGARRTDPLTRREREVMELLRLRLTDPEIAARLFISTRTVESHVANILVKMNAANRRDAAMAAGFLGLI